VCRMTKDYMCGGPDSESGHMVSVYSVEKYEGKTVTAEEGGGCWIEQAKCKTNDKKEGKWYDTDGMWRGADSDEGICKRRARDWFNACRNAELAGDTPITTAKFSPTKAIGTYPGTEGGCLVDAKACAKTPEKAGVRMATKWQSEDSQSQCLASAKETAAACGNHNGEAAITATYNPSNASFTFPGKSAGCVFDFPDNCPKAAKWSGKKNIWPEYDVVYRNDADEREDKCLEMAKPMYGWCRPTLYEKQVVTAKFLPTGKSGTFPSKTGGGCLRTVKWCRAGRPYAVGTSYDYDVDHLKTDVREANCLGRVQPIFYACKINDKYDPEHVVTMTFLPSGATSTFPGTAGGCIIKRDKCPRDNNAVGTFLDYHNGAPLTEAACFQRAKDWHIHCQLTDADEVVATFAGTGKTHSTKGGVPRIELLEQDSSFDIRDYSAKDVGDIGDIGDADAIDSHAALPVTGGAILATQI